MLSNWAPCGAGGLGNPAAGNPYCPQSTQRKGYLVPKTLFA